MTTAIKQAPLQNDVQHVLALLEKFGDLLVRETAALRKADFDTVDTLQADKRQIAREYQDSIATLAGRRDEMARLDGKLRDTLLQKRTGFTLILQDNLKALETMKSNTQRLVNRILETARHAVTDEKQTSYSAKGKTESYKSSSLSLTLDRQL